MNDVKVSRSTLIALFMVLVMVVFSFTLTLIAAIYIVSDLGGSTDIAAYTVTFYGLGNLLGMPLGRSLSYRYGTVRLLCICLHLFAIFSLLCGLATNYFEFLTYRFLQGIVSAPFYILVNQLFSGLIQKDKKPFFSAASLTMYSTVPILAVCWGGWLAYDFHWRAPFFINFIILFILAFVIHRRLNQYQPKIESYEFDGIGYLFYAVGMFCLICVAITGQELDWQRSTLIVTLAIMGVGCLLFFLLWSRHHPYPLFDLTLFRNPLFTFGVLGLILLFANYFGIVTVLPLWLSLDVNYTPLWIGVLLGIMVVTGVVPSLLITTKLRALDDRIPLALAVICFAISCFHTTIFNQYIDFERIAISRILAGFGLVFFLPPIFRMCFRCFAEEKLYYIMELFQIGRILGCLLGTTFYVTLWQRRKIFYHSRYGSDLTAFSEKTRQFFTDIKDFHITGKAADVQLDYFLNLQATSFALDDCFFLMGWTLIIFLVVLISTVFWKKIELEHLR